MFQTFNTLLELVLSRQCVTLTGRAGRTRKVGLRNVTSHFLLTFINIKFILIQRDINRSLGIYGGGNHGRVVGTLHRQAKSEERERVSARRVSSKCLSWMSHRKQKGKVRMKGISNKDACFKTSAKPNRPECSNK